MEQTANLARPRRWPNHGCNRCIGRAVFVGVGRQRAILCGFTDDRQVSGSNRQFADNWELSAQRALTVTRALIDEGIPSAQVFAAAFGAEQPVADNADEKGRAQNRRVEMAPVPRATKPKPP